MGTPATRAVGLLCAVVLLGIAGCHGSSGNGESDGPTPNMGSSTSEKPVQPAPRPPPRRLAIGPEAADADRWLWVEAIDTDARGGWATGSFDPDRNKLELETYNARAFAVDVSRIPIRWDTLVIIGIDGRNSELRRRDYAVLHFARNDHGEWVVVEP